MFKTLTFLFLLVALNDAKKADLLEFLMVTNSSGSVAFSYSEFTSLGVCSLVDEDMETYVSDMPVYFFSSEYPFLDVYLDGFGDMNVQFAIPVTVDSIDFVNQVYDANQTMLNVQLSSPTQNSIFRMLFFDDGGPNAMNCCSWDGVCTKMVSRFLSKNPTATPTTSTTVETSPFTGSSTSTGLTTAGTTPISTTKGLTTTPEGEVIPSGSIVNLKPDTINNFIIVVGQIVNIVTDSDPGVQIVTVAQSGLSFQYLGATTFYVFKI